MLTPQDVTSREFDKAVFGGYDIGAVDRFLEDFLFYSASAAFIASVSVEINTGMIIGLLFTSL